MGDDDAAARREARRREREARRKERENEAAVEEESLRSRRRRKDENQDAEEAERQRKEKEEEERRERERQREREEREAEERRQKEEEERAERRRREKEEEEAEQDQDDAAEEQDGEVETIFDTMSPQKKASILEGLADEFRRIVEQRESKGQMVSVSAAELDELDLKVRSLRTQVRKCEETNNQLTKQKREIDEKLKKNENELNRLRTDLQKAEAENELAIKEGKKVAPTIPKARGAKKASPVVEDVNMERRHRRRKSREGRSQSPDSSPTKRAAIPPTVKPKPKRRTPSSSDHMTDSQIDVRVQLSGDWTLERSVQARKERKHSAKSKQSIISTERRKNIKESLEKERGYNKDRTAERRHKETTTRTAQHKEEQRKVPPPVKTKPGWRAKIGDRELTSKGNLLTLELKTKLQTRRKKTEETGNHNKEQAYFSDPDTSHTHQGNLRKFAKHRRSVRQRNRHRPTTNPVRQLITRQDVRSDL